MSEEEYSSLVASSASSTSVVIEISTDVIKFTYFSVFSAGSVSSNGTGLVSLTFTVSSDVLNLSKRCSGRNFPLPPSQHAGLRYWG